MFKVVIIGGENCGDYRFFEAKCIRILINKAKEGCGIMIYSTGDKFNDMFTSKNRINMRYFKVDWQRDGNNALKVRNESMLSDADAAIVFNNGYKEEEIFIKQANEKNIPLRVIDTTKKAPE